MTLVKICGVTLADDAARVAAAGASFVGLNFWPKSKRYLAPERAGIVAAAARAAGSVKLVGVFVDAKLEDIQRICAQIDLDAIQLHGDESPELAEKVSLAVYRPVWKAIAVASRKDIDGLGAWKTDAILLDAPTPGRGGAGASFDHELAREARQRFPAMKIVLAGGLHAANVADAIERVEPWAVDVASGVEAAPGVKDAAKIAAFISAARGAMM